MQTVQTVETTSSKPSADIMIEKLDTLRGEINRRSHPISLEIDDIAEQWEQLKVIGGARADHAAALLSRLRPAIADLTRFLVRVENQIDDLVANPFGRDDK